MKKKESLAVHVVEDHNDALRHIYRSIATKRLPYHANFLIHLDSHPDLLLPQHLLQSEVYDKETLFERISIENWILPAVFGGHIDAILWLKPPWSNQIRDGVFRFCVGVESATGHVKVSCPELYFISEMLFCEEHELEHSKTVTLYVFTLGNPLMKNHALADETSSREASGSVPHVESSSDFGVSSVLDLASKIIAEHDGRYILDVDLDFFSTLNPFLRTHESVDLYPRLKRIYYFELDTICKSAHENQKIRKLQMEPLSKIFQSLDNLKNPTIIREALPSLLDSITDLDRREQLRLLILDLLEKVDSAELDWLLVHDAGCTWDSPQQVLPEHQSTEQEIKDLMQLVGSIMRGISAPAVVTIARSSLDDYCPPHQVDLIQELLCSILKTLGPNIEVLKHY